jgi:hypothetical protein
VDADHVKDADFHSFKELMRDHANQLPDHFYWEGLEELRSTAGAFDGTGSGTNRGACESPRCRWLSVP